MGLKQTPSQTVGPFFPFALAGEQYGYAFKSIAGASLARAATEGERIRVLGRVLDGKGEPIDDALVEIWQANAHGRYNHAADGRRDNYDPAFTGFGRTGTGTDPEHRFIFDTVKPGAIGDGQAPHLNVTVFMRGLQAHAYTRIYFSDEGQANAADPVLLSVPRARRATLIAQREKAADGVVYRLDIHMQGERETVFFDV